MTASSTYSLYVDEHLEMTENNNSNSKRFEEALTQMRLLKQGGEGVMEQQFLPQLKLLIGHRLRSLLFDLLRGINDNGVSHQVAERRLSSFFNFAIQCVKEDLLTNEDILVLFEDLYECCQESQLSTLFPLFERAIHGSRPDGTDKIQLHEN